jgi:PhzF family phenazine biosynthesis protein
VPFERLDDVMHLRPDADALIALAKPLGCEGCYAFTLDAREPDVIAHARGFFPGIGIAEDPATGSAAGPLGVYLVERRIASPDRWLTIKQGDEIERPSRIEVRVSGRSVEVGGSCAIAAAGELGLPA